MRKLVFIGYLEKYRKDIATSRSAAYDRLLAQADRYDAMALPALHPPSSTTYMGIAIANLALAYLLSGDEKYLRNAKRFMATVVSYEKWGNAHLVNVDLSASWILFGLSLGYDWLKPYLTPVEAAAILQKLRHHARIIYDYRRETYGRGWSTNFLQNHNWINMTGLATAGYVLLGEEESAQAYICAAKENFARVFALLPEDGSNYEGVVYWRYGGMWLFVYAHLLKVQEGIDYFKTSAYLRNTFYYRLFQSAGDLRQQLNFGDCHDRYSGHCACVYYKTAAEYSDGYAQKLGNMTARQFLMQEHENSKVKPGILPEAVFEFLWYEPSVQEREFDTLPKCMYFADIGLMSIRSGWDVDAKVLTIKCSPPGGRKQWENGWRIRREEKVELFSLSHHHPDNLSYIFTRGGSYFTCEDGYNRNIMADNHNVLLVDGRYTDAQNVNDVYMASVKMRMERQGETFHPADYSGFVRTALAEDELILYRAETSGVYPAELKMNEVSRTLLTDGLKFWVFVDVFHSETEHTYGIVCNTDEKAEKADGSFRYSLGDTELEYQVLSAGELSGRQYEQQVVSVMTTQEPDQKCEVRMQTVAVETARPCKHQVFFECFTFADHPASVRHLDDGLCLECDGTKYRICTGEYDGKSKKTPIQICVGDRVYCL